MTVLESGGCGRASGPGVTGSGPLAIFVVLLMNGCGGAAPSDRRASADPSLSALPTPSFNSETPSPYEVGDLPDIVVTADTLPSGMTIDDELTGQEALVQPVALLTRTSFPQQPGFVDAVMTRLGTSGPGSYWEEGGYVTWAALYLSPEAAAAAFDVLVGEHITGWGMEEAGSPAFGDDGVTLQGPAYGFDTRLHVWRSANLLMAAAALGSVTTERVLDRIAAGVHARADAPDLSLIVLDAEAPPAGTSVDDSRSTPAAVIDRVVISGRESQWGMDSRAR